MNLISPYGAITKYEFPPLKGFFIHPKSDAADSGWTVTTNVDTGEVYIPGTSGGGGTYRFIGWGTDGRPGWKINHTPGDFYYGEVDWVGKQKNPALPTHGKYRLSYHGPTTRYFGSDRFSYGSSEDHNNIYMEGRCISVAPGPVLGAALRVEKTTPTAEEEEAGVTPIDVLVLFVVCLVDDQEHVYRKELQSFSAGVTRTKYTEKFRNKEMALYDDDENPTGWYLIGSFSITSADQFGGATLGTPRVPWFFNESATEAVCVRECDTTLSILGVEEVQKSYNKFLLKIDANGFRATHSDEGQTGPGFTVKITTKLERNPDWVNNTPWPSVLSPAMIHTWAVIELRQVLVMTGHLIVAADYEGDTQVEMKYEIDHTLRFSHFLYKGDDDPEEFAAAGDSRYANTGDMYGDLVYVAGLDLDLDTVQEPFGKTTVVSSINEQAYLTIEAKNEKHPIYKRLSGTRTEFETGTIDPQDYINYYTFSLTQYPHVVDLRQHYLASYIDYLVYTKLLTTYKDRYKSEQIYTGESPDYTVIAENKDPQTTIPTIGLGFIWSDVFAAGYPATSGKYTWDVEHVEEYRVLDGLWYVAGMQEGRWPEDVPSPIGYFETSTVYKLDADMTPIHTQLQSPENCYRNMGSGRDDYGNLAFSLEYRTPEGELKYYNYLDNGDMVSLTKANGENIRFFSIGVS